MIPKEYLAVLETMWDWRSMTSDAGYIEEAPRFYQINPENFSGKRLYALIEDDAFLNVTNVCREVVSGPQKHGNPDKTWLRENIDTWTTEMAKESTILVCGQIAQETFADEMIRLVWKDSSHRVVYLPHPANRTWSIETLEQARLLIQDESYNICMELKNGILVHRPLYTRSSQRCLFYEN